MRKIGGDGRVGEGGREGGKDCWAKGKGQEEERR